MKEKRLSEIEKEWQGHTVRSLIAEIRRLREVLERVKAVWEDVHDETSIVGIIDNALGMEER